MSLDQDVPLCTIVNGSASYFFSMFLNHTGNFVFTDSQKLSIMKAFVSVEFNVEAIYITNCHTQSELVLKLQTTIEKYFKQTSGNILSFTCTGQTLQS